MALEALQNKEQAIEELFSVLKEAKDREEANVQVEIPRAFEHLPKDLHKDVQEKFDRLKSYGLSEKQLAYELKKDVENVKAAYEDKRFEIPNGSYLRLVLKQLIDILVGIAEEPVNIVKIRGLGMINIDVNGLKTVNDIIGHDTGTEYLRRIVRVFTEGKTTKELESKGINVFVSSNGGDEFVLILSDDVYLGERVNGDTFINETLKKYQEEVSQIAVSDIVRFETPEVRAKFADIAIPDGFTFTASISGGTAHVEEVLFADGFTAQKGASYTEMLDIIISSLFRISDGRSKTDKNRFKDELEASGDPHKHFLAMLLKRNLDTARIEAENKRLKQLLEKNNLLS